jgi:hypothetical protein
MLLIVEVVLLVFGIIAMVKKKWSAGGGKEVLGGHAQVLGAIAAAVLPINLVLGVGMGIAWGLTRPGKAFPTGWATMMEAGVVVAAGILLAVLGNRFHAKQAAHRVRQAAMEAELAAGAGGDPG